MDEAGCAWGVKELSNRTREVRRTIASPAGGSGLVQLSNEGVRPLSARRTRNMPQKSTKFRRAGVVSQRCNRGEICAVGRRSETRSRELRLFRERIDGGGLSRT